jgi:hypothetical protein
MLNTVATLRSLLTTGIIARKSANARYTQTYARMNSSVAAVAAVVQVSAAVQTAAQTTNTRRYGWRRPRWSALAPRSGESTAITRAPSVTAQPRCAPDCLSTTCRKVPK